MLSIGRLSPFGKDSRGRWSEQAGAVLERRSSAPPGASESHSPTRLASGGRDSGDRTGFRSPGDDIESGTTGQQDRVETEDNILLPKVRKGLGPNSEGDMIILIYDGTPKEMLANILGRLMSAGLELKVRSVRDTIARGRSESDFEEEGYDCCFGGCRCGTRDCCQATCIRRSALAKILPACVSNLDAMSSDVDVIVFVSASYKRLVHEEHAVARDCKLRSETEIIEVKDVLVEDSSSVAPITPARRSFLILSAIERPEAEGGAGISIKDTNCIFRAFTQHDSTFLAHIVENIFNVSGIWRELERGNVLSFLHRMFGQITLDGMSTETMKTLRFPETRRWTEMESKRVEASRRSLDNSESDGGDSNSSSYLYAKVADYLESLLFGNSDISSDEYIVHELRTHYGEEIAWFYAFQRHFINALFWPSLLSIVFTILYSIFGSNSPTGMKIKFFFGVGIVLIWAPFHIAKWEQKQWTYRFLWSLDKVTWEHCDGPNPDFQGTVVVDEATGEKSKHYAWWKTLLVAIVRICFVIAFIAAWFLLAIVFSYVFLAAKIRLRGFAMIIVNLAKDIVQGIFMAALGTLIFKALVVGIVDFENYAKKGEKGRAVISTFFFLDFWNFCVGLLVFALFFQPLKQSSTLAAAICDNRTQFGASVVEGDYMLFGPTSNNTRCDMIADSRRMIQMNATGMRLLDQHPKPNELNSYMGNSERRKMDFNSTKNMFAAEDISVAMIGPVVVARIFITLFGTLLPFIIQSRRRRVVLAALRARMQKYGFSGDMLFRRRRKSERLLAKLNVSEKSSIDKTIHNDDDKGKESDGIHSHNGKTTARVAPAAYESKGESPRTGTKIELPRPTIKTQSSSPRIADKHEDDPVLSKFVNGDLGKIIMIQNLYRGLRARRLKVERLMALKQADELIEESALENIDQQGIYQDVLVQITIVTLFSATSPWIPVVMGVLGAIDSRVRITALLFSFKKTVPRKTPDIGLYFELWKWSYYFCLFICPLILLFSGSYVDSFVTCSGRRGELFDSGTAGAILSVLAYPLSNDFGDLPALSPDTDEFEACSTFGQKSLFYVIFILLGVSVHWACQVYVASPPHWLNEEIKRRNYLTKCNLFQNRKAMENTTMRNPRYRRSSTAPPNMIMSDKSRELKIKTKALSVVQEKGSDTVSTAVPAKDTSFNYIGQAKAALILMDHVLPSHASKWKEWTKKLRLQEAEVEATLQRVTD